MVIVACFFWAFDEDQFLRNGSEVRFVREQGDECDTRVE